MSRPRAGPSNPTTRSRARPNPAIHRSGQVIGTARAGNQQQQPSSSSSSSSPPPRGRAQDQMINEGQDEGGNNGEDIVELMEKAIEKAKLEIGKAVYESKVHSFVRLALFWEYKRIPLRRDDINKKVIEKATKHFKPIFYSTQRLLRSRFGMELVELRSKGLIGNSQTLESGSQVLNTRNGAMMKRKNGIGRKRRRGGVDGNNDDNDDDDDDDDHDDDDTNGPDDSAAIPTTQVAREKAPTSASRTYILRSTLPPSLLSLLTIVKPLQTYPESDGLTSGGGGTQRIPDCGAILDVDNEDGSGGVGLMGLLWVILGIILVHDRSIRDDTLHKILKNKLLIESNTILPFTTPLSTSNPPTLDTYLKQLTKQGYLESIKIGGHSNATRNVDGGVVVDVEWRWGGRADAEIGERAVAEFMADLHAKHQDTGEDDDNVANIRSAPRGQNTIRVETPEMKRKKLMGAIEKAAGGELMK